MHQTVIRHNVDQPITNFLFKPRVLGFLEVVGVVSG
jgi:hypothetical protein